MGNTESKHEPSSYADYLRAKYVPELDGLRALCVLMVITVHMHARYLWRWVEGAQGVTIFFVISGYLITTLALREEQSRGRLSLTAFYVRRSFRIFPLYYFVLALYCVLVFGVRIGSDSKRLFLMEALPWYLFYMQEAPTMFGLPDQNGVYQTVEIPFYQSWSLGIEEKFYLFWPLIAFVIWRNNPRTRLFGTAALVIVFALVRLPFELLAPFLPGWKLPSFGMCFDPYYRILCGCLLGLLLHHPSSFAQLRGLATARATWISLVLLLTLHFGRSFLPLYGEMFFWIRYTNDKIYTWVVCAFLVGVLLGNGPIQRFLRWRHLVFVGRLSYGMYLVHVLCLNVAEKMVVPAGNGAAANILAYVLTCVLSICFAYLLFRFIEQPCIEIGRRWSKRILDEQAPNRLTWRQLVCPNPQQTDS